MDPELPSRTVSVAVDRLEGGTLARVDDAVATEEPLEIRVVPAGEPAISVSVTMRTPGHDFELAAGFLFTEDVIRGPGDVARIDYAEDALPERRRNVVEVVLRPRLAFDRTRLSRSFYTSSSCGVCGKTSLDALYFAGRRAVTEELAISDRVLRALPARLREAQELFAATGGLHAAGLFRSDGELVLLREDVGRHNAVDKLVGERLLAGLLPLRQHVLVLSGRASFELMQKAVAAGLPVVAAVGAPSSLAVETAREYGMTLVGFLRGDGYNVYANGERIRVQAG